MIKIKDRIILGMISGIVAALPAQLANAVEHKLGLIDIPYSQLASKLFIPERKIKSTTGKSLSFLINSINTSVTGVFLTYLLSFTGKDKAIIKGIGTGTVLWVIGNGFVSNTLLTKKPKKTITPFLSCLDHAVYGGLCSLLITRFGDDIIFPSNPIRRQLENTNLRDRNH